MSTSQAANKAHWGLGRALYRAWPRATLQPTLAVKRQSGPENKDCKAQMQNGGSDGSGRVAGFAVDSSLLGQDQELVKQ